MIGTVSYCSSLFLTVRHYSSLFVTVTDRSEISPHAIENCYGATMKQSFNNIDYSLLGYNALKGYPLEDGMDPGFTAPIFAADYSGQHVSADCRYSLPQGIHAYPEVSCQTSFSSKEIKSQKQFSDAFSTSVQGGGGGWGVTFSASAGYKKASSSLATGESLLIMSTATCLYYKTRLMAHSPPPLHEEFKAFIADIIDATDKEEAVHDFLDTYGTHFVTEIDYGARYTKQHEMKYTQYDVAKQSSFNIGLQASYSGAFSIGGGFNLDSEQRQAAMDFSKSVTTTTQTVGATPPASGDNMEWASEVKLNPMPIRLKLQSIDTLFHARYMAGVQGHSEVRRLINQHKTTYCSRLARHLGVEDTCATTYTGSYMPCHLTALIGSTALVHDSIPAQTKSTCIVKLVNC